MAGGLAAVGHAELDAGGDLLPLQGAPDHEAGELSRTPTVQGAGGEQGGLQVCHVGLPGVGPT